jgi:RHS repeat-associated protein
VGKPYYYDVENHLTNYNNTVFLTYNGDGMRVSKTVGATNIYYLLDDRNPSGYAQVLEEWRSTGIPGLDKVYNYGLDLISQRQVAGGTVSYYGFDGHGSTRFLTSTNGTITDTYTYDAYGTLIVSTGLTPNNYLYAGQQRDFDLGLDLNRSRYWNPGTGRFWTMDTFAGNNEDPLSLHKYLYGADDPVNEIDPLGQSFFAFDGTGNSPANPYQTNVRKMWFGSTDPDRHYEVGVGTGMMGLNFGGQAFGAGMARRERKAMREIIADRAQGDTTVDIVGFSRGGIEATEFANEVADAFPNETIRFVGLFDPVGSVGHPGGFGRYRTQLPASVGYSVEAMAANENRSWFPGTDVNVNLQQWFRGTHSDIGGGWPNHQLSDYVLQWMIQQAQSKGVGINLSAIQAQFGWDPNPNGPIDPNTGVTSWSTTGSIRNVIGAGYSYTIDPSDMGF